LCSNGMGQTPGNERPILVARRGSSPLTAPSFIRTSFSNRLEHYVNSRRHALPFLL
jgi:hypothetical protein